MTAATAPRFPQTKPRPWELPRPALPADAGLAAILTALHEAGVTCRADDTYLELVGPDHKPIPAELARAAFARADEVAVYAERTAGLAACWACGGGNLWSAIGSDVARCQRCDWQDTPAVRRAPRVPAGRRMGRSG